MLPYKLQICLNVCPLLDWANGLDSDMTRYTLGRIFKTPAIVFLRLVNVSLSVTAKARHRRTISFDASE